MSDEIYPAYCKTCGYRWESQAKNKPPNCPKCNSNKHVVYGDDIPQEEDPGTPLHSEISKSDDIVDTARDIIDMTSADIDWDRIRRLEIDHKPRVIVVHFKDTAKMFGIELNSMTKEARLMDRQDLERYSGNPAGVVSFMYEEVGWQILQGEIPIQVARYEYQEQVIDITTIPGKEEMFWMACSSIFNDIRQKNIDILKEIGEW